MRPVAPAASVATGNGYPDGLPTPEQIMASSTADDTRPVSERVIEAVAAAADTDPAELDPLYEVVDPDALDALFDDPSPDAPRTTGQVILRVAGRRVVVDADGSVEVAAAGGETPPGDDEASTDGGEAAGALDDTAGGSDDGEASPEE